MSYRNSKREVAVWILDQLKSRDFKVTAEILDGVTKEINSRVYADFQLSDLIEASPNYGRELMRDAADLLVLKNHILLFENERNIFDVKIRMLHQGEIALHEGLYEDDIRQYNSDRFYSRMPWVIPLLSLILAVSSLVYAIFANYSAKCDIIRLQEQQIKLEQATKTLPNR